MSDKNRSLWIQTKKTRGERFYQKIPKIGAIFFEKLMDSEMIDRQIDEIKEEILSTFSNGKLLEVGPGPGALLHRIYQENSNAELHGLDVSKAMVRLARKNLEGTNIRIKNGNIKKTDFESDYFDLITCTGSFYLWDDPIESLNEVFRILKIGGVALFFETYSDYDKKKLKKPLARNISKIKFYKRLVVKKLLLKQLSITYSIQEVLDILNKTSFSETSSIEKIVLSNLPIWVKISLQKR